jgi:hypothetical protein
MKSTSKLFIAALLYGASATAGVAQNRWQDEAKEAEARRADHAAAREATQTTAAKPELAPAASPADVQKTSVPEASPKEKPVAQ